jgi:hypothetical protein
MIKFDLTSIYGLNSQDAKAKLNSVLTSMVTAKRWNELHAFFYQFDVPEEQLMRPMRDLKLGLVSKSLIIEQMTDLVWDRAIKKLTTRSSKE